MAGVGSIMIAAGLGAAAAGAVGLHVGAGPVKKQAIAALARACAARRALVLTYDDGPGVSLTPRVLERLQDGQARATFFLLGRRASANPEVVDAVVAAGHEVGCHTERHLNAMRTLPWRAVNDIHEGYRTLSRWMRPNSLFRPPYGKVTVPTLLSLRRRGAPVCFWTHDSGDTTEGRLPDPGAVAERVARDGGGVVLLHDFDRDKDAAERAKYVLDTTDQILLASERERLTLLTMGELLGLAPP